MRKLTTIIAGMVFLLVSAASCCSQKVETSVPHKVKDGRIVLEAPERAAGQESALLMACDPIDTVRVGFIGVGMRGESAVYRFTFIDGVKIVALCDLEQDYVSRSQRTLANRNLPAAAEYVGEEAWKELCIWASSRAVWSAIPVCWSWRMRI